MKSHCSPFLQRSRRGVFTVALAAIGFASSTGLAQSESPSAKASDQDVVTLSPFTVSTNQDVGYLANSTLSGTRTNTAVKDIANPLDIFTAELMNDLGIEDIQDLTNFANGVEPNAAGGFNSDGQEREVWNYNYMQIRGFKTGTLTRNFMDLNAQFEAYNSERVEFSKGPNAILSGSGNPGGTVNYATKRPNLHKDAYSLQLRGDDLGSARASVDINKVLIPDVLGLRLNAMWEDQEFYRHPSYEKQKAWHLVGSWQPTRNTTVTLGHENRSSDRASPRGIFARDRVTAWLNAGSPLVSSVPASNRVVIAGTTASVSPTPFGMATVNGDLWSLNSDGEILNYRRTARGDVISVNSNNLDTAATGIDFPEDVWVGGANGINDSDWDITEFNVTQRLNDDFYVDFSYGHTSNDVRQGNSVSRELYVDTNDFGSFVHAGEIYAETRPFWIDRDIDVDHYRATASYNLDLTKKGNKWLGQHQIALAVEYNEHEEAWNNGRLTLVETPTGVIDPTTISGGFQSSSLAFNFREYLDFSSTPAMRDLRSLYYSDGINQDGYVAKFLRREGYASTHNLTKQDSTLGVLQSRWWDGRIITTVGLRKDERKNYVAPFVQDPITNLWVPASVGSGVDLATALPKDALFTTPAEDDGGISRNYGGVIHATKWLSFSYNYATNFSPRTESRGLFGDYIPSSSGQSNDIGARFSLFEDKVSISIIHYETEELNSATNGGGINSPFTRMQSIEDILVDNGIIASTPLVGVWTTADRTAKGEEVTIVGSPTRNWTLRLSASKLDNKQRNLAPDVRAYYLEKLPFYEAQNPNLTATGGTTLLSTYITQAKEQYALLDTRENVSVFPASEYSFVGTAKYSFARDSAIKGLAIGGTVRWKSAPIIGYYKTNDGSFDVERFNRGDSQTLMDLFVSYRYKMMRGIEGTVQLNVSNLFDNHDPYPVNSINTADSTDFTWVNTAYRPQDGRVFSITNTFKF